MLYHVSEQVGIGRFDPRPSPGVDRPVVWAVDRERLRNYLLPRDCPRVTFFRGTTTSPADAERLVGGVRAVVAVEAAWLDRIRRTRLYCYALPPESFKCVDANAGYFHSPTAVVPVDVRVVNDCLGALVEERVEIRILPSLWPLYDAVVASSVSYSIIRMRNATPREGLSSLP